MSSAVVPRVSPLAAGSARSRARARVRARPSRRRARSSSGLRASSSDPSDEGVSLSDLVEMEIGGVSVTPRGLAAILVPAGGAKDALPRASNAVETLRGAEVDVVPREFASAPALAVLVTDTDTDADAATSEYAQAMMQYLQDPPCDMGIQLPYDALDRVTGGPSGAKNDKENVTDADGSWADAKLRKRDELLEKWIQGGASIDDDKRQ